MTVVRTSLVDERDSSSTGNTSGGYSTIVGTSLADDRVSSFTDVTLAGLFTHTTDARSSVAPDHKKQMTFFLH